MQAMLACNQGARRIKAEGELELVRLLPRELLAPKPESAIQADKRDETYLLPSSPFIHTMRSSLRIGLSSQSSECTICRASGGSSLHARTTSRHHTVSVEAIPAARGCLSSRQS